MANSEVVTREDLKNVFEALGEGDYETRIDNIEETLTAPFTTKNFTLSNQSVSTWYKDFTIDVTLSGYTPIGFKGISSNQANKYFYWRYFDGNTAHIGVANNGNSGTISSFTLGIVVVYIKTSLLG